MTGISKDEKERQKSYSRKNLLPYIHVAARRLKVQSRLPLSVELDDLVQAGAVGLLEAEQRYDANLGASFETYANRRIHGAMLDELRASDWLPRSVRRQARVAERIHGELEQRYGRAVRERDIAEVMEIPLHSYNRHVNDVHNGCLLGYEEQENECRNEMPLDGVPEYLLMHIEREDLLYQAIAALDNIREREALVLYHLKGMSLKSIGERFGISESRVCQLHRRGLEKLRRWFRNHYPEMLDSDGGRHNI